MIKSKKEYKQGKVEKLWDWLAIQHKENPDMFENGYTIRDALATGVYQGKKLQRWKELGDKTRCPNCNSNMQISQFNIDSLNAQLLLSMHKVVSERLQNGMSFTEANKVELKYLPQLSHYRDNFTLASRRTQCRYLNLIAKLKKDGRQVKDTWVITRRGWVFLSGKQVPEWVRVFNKEIICRSDTFTTLSKAVEDNKGILNDYDPVDWANYVDSHQGVL